MKLIFTYTDTPDLSALSKAAIFNIAFEIPDEALQLIDLKERVLAIAELVSKFTLACLHISCKELELKNHPVKTSFEHDPYQTLYHENRPLIILFKQGNYFQNQKRQLKILMPGKSIFPSRAYIFNEKLNLARSLTQINYRCTTDRETLYAQYLNNLIQHLVVLLGTEPIPADQAGWVCEGFHPAWRDAQLISREKQRAKKVLAERRKQEKEEERRKLREAKLAEKTAKLAEKGMAVPAETPKTGAGRRGGAVPGIFKGIQFRSQLEIRFATELEERGINWVYEAERLGEGSYLVDFYLPDYGAWVEVKGQFEARDNFLLKDVADYLKKERGQRLFVFTSGKPRLVNPSGYRELARAEFWTMLLK